jgi:putative membrane protein insertion efficiency factor
MSVAARGLAGLVRAYQLVVSPWITQQCRYYPSCSAYALTAVQTHGALRGTWLALRRLLRCHPWTPGGVDHVPPAPLSRSRTTAPPPESSGPERRPVPVQPART